MLKDDLPFSPQRALISVSDKKDIVGLAKKLVSSKVELVATGHTAQLLRSHDIPVIDVSTCTGCPEMMDGRVKTLHPAIHAGLLARGEKDSKALKTHQIKTFDILIVNLYPFEQAISTHDCDFQTAIEHIDIGGPAMIRSAAKNHEHVLVAVDPDDYPLIENALLRKQLPHRLRFLLAKKAFAHTAAYDAAIANYLSMLDEEQKPAGFPSVLTCQFTKQLALRYGENPHQQAIFYRDKNPLPNSLATMNQVQGKPLSYNNLLDADAALDCVKSFPHQTPTCVIVKHSNPCGIAVGETPTAAYLRAFSADPQSAYGGILAFNQHIDADTAKAILETQYAEIVIAPALAADAVDVFAAKPSIRVLTTGYWNENHPARMDLRSILGGVLIQEHDDGLLQEDLLEVVTARAPSEEEMETLLFAWIAAKHVKSNAIVLAHNKMTIGIGAGQTSRVMSARIALWQADAARFSTIGACMASDGFLPFRDTIESAAQAQISAIIQPGGSIRDQEIITAANQAGIAMVFTGYRHFRH